MSSSSSRRVRNVAEHVKPSRCQGADLIGACGACNTPRKQSPGPWAPPPAPFRPSACSSEAEYGWKQVHDDLENGLYAGSYGWDNAAYWGISEMKAGIDLKEWYKTRTEAEFYLPEFKELIDNPDTQKDWDNIVTFDPLGMTAHPPTIASCKARLDILELKDLEPDGEVVLPGTHEIVTSKCAIYYSWNLPRLATRLELSEDELRQCLHKYSRDDRLLDPKIRTYIPAVGGCTCYTFGDARKLRDPKTETCVRVHDECIGSDVFGSDICSCRPYLIFALREAVKCAQRGGVGIVVYYRKEGRSLGEVIKFRVYNARINQKGGDTAENYFNHTEQIAGIRDARFQTMMPDVLNWMGVRRIDWLCSMSNEKYEAITGAGIRVMQRVDLPEDYIKESMMVELTAKIASGYHSDALDRKQMDIGSLGPIRKQCGRLMELAQKGESEYFTVHPEKMAAAVDLTEKSIRERYPSLKVPPHSRLRHFDEKQLAAIVDGWKCDGVEKARRVIDLVTISVLLDAGAGPDWRYRTADGNTIASSEGLAAASLDLFLDGFFSTDTAMKTRVNSLALCNITDDALARGLQVSRSNPLIGVQGRAKVLRSLGECLQKFPDFFGGELQRPGNMVDYLLKNSDGKEVPLDCLWKVCSEGFYNIWPLQTNGAIRGDVWTHSKLKVDGQAGSDLVPFHKLTQWLVYSLMDALDMCCGLKVSGLSALTGLPEYRNGGLLLDTGVIALKDPSWSTHELNVGTELIVEWRALTVVLLDQLAAELRKKLGVTEEVLPLAAVLEGGTWHAGRAIAKSLRADGSSPIKVRLDGTVF